MAETAVSTLSILSWSQASSPARAQNVFPEGQSLLGSAVPSPWGRPCVWGELTADQGLQASCNSSAKESMVGYREESQKLFTCLPMSAGLDRNWFCVITQHDIYCKQIFLPAHNRFSQFTFEEPHKFFKILLCGLCSSSFTKTIIRSWGQISPQARATRSQKKPFSKNSRIANKGLSTLLSWVWKIIRYF